MRVDVPQSPRIHRPTQQLFYKLFLFFSFLNGISIQNMHAQPMLLFSPLHCLKLFQYIHSHSFFIECLLPPFFHINLHFSKNLKMQPVIIKSSEKQCFYTNIHASQRILIIYKGNTHSIPAEAGPLQRLNAISCLWFTGP